MYIDGADGGKPYKSAYSAAKHAMTNAKDTGFSIGGMHAAALGQIMNEPALPETGSCLEPYDPVLAMVLAGEI